MLKSSDWNQLQTNNEQLAVHILASKNIKMDSKKLLKIAKLDKKRQPFNPIKRPSKQLEQKDKNGINKASKYIR